LAGRLAHDKVATRGFHQRLGRRRSSSPQGLL
jgi:hypothetical protein